MLWRKRRINIDFFHHSDVGGREENEDNYGVFSKGSKEYCFLIADGLGGHGGGFLASKTAVNAIKEQFEQSSALKAEDISAWFQEVNRQILDMQTGSCKMKTTLVMLYIKNRSAIWGHVGDSRLYHFINNKLVSQTFDHSVSQLAVARGEICQEEIRDHCDRNKLLRALGRDGNVKVEISEEIQLQGKRHSFLLCTDGFWEYVYETEMEEALQQASDAQEWIRNMLVYIKQRHNSENDNNTAVAVIIDER